MPDFTIHKHPVLARLFNRAGAMLKGPPHHRQTGFARPHRGARGAAPQMSIIVALANRVACLRAAGVGDNLPPGGLILGLPTIER